MSYENRVKMREVGSFSEGVNAVINSNGDMQRGSVLGLIDVDFTLTKGLHAKLIGYGPLSHLADESMIIPDENFEALNLLVNFLGRSNVAFVTNRTDNLFADLFWSSSRLLHTLPQDIKLFEGLNRQLPHTFFTHALIDWIASYPSVNKIVLLSDHNMIKVDDTRFLQHLVKQIGHDISATQYLIKR